MQDHLWTVLFPYQKYYKKQTKCQKLLSTTRVYYKIQPYTWNYYEKLHTYVLQNYNDRVENEKKGNNNKEKTDNHCS